MAFEERATNSLVEDGAAAGQDAEPASSGRSPVVERMLAEGYLFDFFQAVWLLEQVFPDAPTPGETLDLTRERIRFRPHSGLSFPASDIKGIEWQEEDERRVRLTLTFMGLYGVASPLPYYFYDAITREGEETEPLRDFLDIFNHRLYAFFYRAWKKYRPSFDRQRQKAAFHTRIFESLAGLGTPGVVQPPSLPFGRLVALGGQLANRVRNVTGLEHLTRDLLGALPVRVVENMPRWVPLSERPLMGSTGSQAALLGVNAVVGQQVKDVSGKFRLVVGPLNLAQYRSLLPGGKQALLVDYTVRLYAPDFLAYDVDLQLKTSEVPPLRLGGDQMMGRDMWLGRPAGDLVSVIVAYN